MASGTRVPAGVLSLAPYRCLVLRTLRQPRYAALSVLMLIVATVCVLAGTWQIARLSGKVGANDELRHNAHAAPAAVDTILPLVGSAGAPPNGRAVQFRTAQVTGTFDVTGQTLVRDRSVDISEGDDDPLSDNGYLVLTPLVTSNGTLLVVRGFVSGGNLRTAYPQAPPPPSGTVTVLARVEPAEARHDDADRLPAGQVESINPVEQAPRLGRPLYDGYAELLAGQPGVGSLVPIPTPSLSNPAGGAIEPQHVAYIIQWYLFAMLALAAPFAMARAEARHEQEREFDDTEPDVEPIAAPHPDPVLSSAELRAARLSDRYGRPVR